MVYKAKIKIAIILTLLLFCRVTQVRGLGLSANSAILIDAENGRVLFESNGYERLGMASTTKIMTAIVALERAKLNDIVTAGANAARTEGTSIWLMEGEKLTMEELLYALMLTSGNDAAVAIAEHVGGSIDKFAQMMNETAKKIGANHTNFTNPHGLADPNHYTTAFDLAQITRYAFRNEAFAAIVKTTHKTIPRAGYEWGRSLTNHNKMLTMYEGANGVKTGYTKKTGRTLVSSATRGELQLIAVTLNAPDDWADHTNMLNYGFSAFKKHVLMEEGAYVKTITVKNKYAGLVLGEELSGAITDDELARVEFEYDIDQAIANKAKSGDIVGEIRAINGREILGKSILVVKEVEGTKDEGDSFAEIFGRLWRSLATQS
ncbi:MAG: D-alanyl-D-alanine carboxypeptidase [Clostridiales bacterium]|jgi:D-alanyl-D-alanine carboxypeptidase|nr:D-alanyl-D-alanine carboxypeptidase [Clostridiales bacterium]